MGPPERIRGESNIETASAAFVSQRAPHPEAAHTHLRWSMHCITLPKVPSPRVLTISSVTQDNRDRDRERERERKGGKKRGEMERRNRGIRHVGPRTQIYLYIFLYIYIYNAKGVTGVVDSSAHPAAQPLPSDIGRR